MFLVNTIELCTALSCIL